MADYRFQVYPPDYEWDTTPSGFYPQPPPIGGGILTRGISVEQGEDPGASFEDWIKRAMYMGPQNATEGWQWEDLRNRFADASRPRPPYVNLEQTGQYFEVIKSRYDAFQPTVDDVRHAEGLGVFDWYFNNPPFVTPEECYSRLVGGIPYAHCRYPTDILTALWREKTLCDSDEMTMRAQGTQVARYVKGEHTCDEFPCSWIDGLVRGVAEETYRVLTDEPSGYFDWGYNTPPGEPPWRFEYFKNTTGAPNYQTPGLGIEARINRSFTSNVWYFDARVIIGARGFLVGFHWDRNAHYYPDTSEDGRFSFRVPKGFGTNHELDLGTYAVDLWLVPPYDEWPGTAPNKPEWDAIQYPGARKIKTFSQAELGNFAHYVIPFNSIPEVDFSQTEGEVLFMFRDVRENLREADFLPGSMSPSANDFMQYGAPCFMLAPGSTCTHTWDDPACLKTFCRYDIGSGLDATQPWGSPAVGGRPVQSLGAFGHWYPSVGDISFWP